jgi:hypothetical protein
MTTKCDCRVCGGDNFLSTQSGPCPYCDDNGKEKGNGLMPKPKWCVRVMKKVVFETDAIPDTLIDCMDRAGLWTNHEDCIDIHMDSPDAARRLAERMDSFGYNAVKAPRWPQETQGSAWLLRNTIP